MCLDTIQDKLICENIALVLVNLTEDKQVLKNYDPKQMEQKIRDSVKADHTICSSDGRFCTTYNLFAGGDGAGDAIYTKDDNNIIGFCTGFDEYKDAIFLAYLHKDSRCNTTKSEYELYEFDIQDLTDKSITLIYKDWGAEREEIIEGLKTIRGWMGDLETCIANKKHGTADTYRALKADYGALGLDLCERDNSTQDTIDICKAQVLSVFREKTMRNIQNLTFEKTGNKLRDFRFYKSMVESYYLDTLFLKHQADLLLTKCEKE